jgi:hypothetical protein
MPCTSRLPMTVTEGGLLALSLGFAGGVGVEAGAGAGVSDGTAGAAGACVVEESGAGAVDASGGAGAELGGGLCARVLPVAVATANMIAIAPCPNLPPIQILHAGRMTSKRRTGSVANQRDETIETLAWPR